MYSFSSFSTFIFPIQFGWNSLKWCVLFLNCQSLVCVLKISMRKTQESIICFPVSSISHWQLFFKCWGSFHFMNFLLYSSFIVPPDWCAGEEMTVLWAWDVTYVFGVNVRVEIMVCKKIGLWIFLLGSLRAVFWFWLTMLLLPVSQLCQWKLQFKQSQLRVSCCKLQGHLHVVVAGMLELSFSSAVCFLRALPAFEWRRGFSSPPLS